MSEPSEVLETFRLTVDERQYTDGSRPMAEKLRSVTQGMSNNERMEET